MALNDEVLNRLKRESTASKICHDLKLDRFTLFNIIKELHDNNIYYYPKVCSNGDISFSLKKPNADENINLRVNDGEFSFVSISDTHVGSVYDRVDRFDSVGEFIDKNNIKLLVNTGDLIDGPVHFNQSMEKRTPDLESQIEEFISTYPYIDGTNVVVLGDHDLKYKTHDGYSINKALKNERLDLKVYSSGAGIVKINNKEILLCHDANDPRIKSRIMDDQILISGHSHMYMNNTRYTSYGASIKVVNPALCNLPMYNHNMPGFLKFNLTYESGILIKVVIENYAFIQNEIYLVGTTNYIVSENKNSYSRKKR